LALLGEKFALLWGKQTREIRNKLVVNSQQRSALRFSLLEKGGAGNWTHDKTLDRRDTSCRGHLRDAGFGLFSTEPQRKCAWPKLGELDRTTRLHVVNPHDAKKGLTRMEHRRKIQFLKLTISVLVSWSLSADFLLGIVSWSEMNPHRNRGNPTRQLP